METLDVSKHLALADFPDLSPQVKHPNGKYKYKMRELRAAQKMVVPPFHQIMVSMCTNEDMSTSLGIVQASLAVAQKAALLILPAKPKPENSKTVIQITKSNDQIYKVNPSAVLANFIFLAPNHGKNVKTMPLDELNLLCQFPGEALQVI